MQLCLQLLVDGGACRELFAAYVGASPAHCWLLLFCARKSCSNLASAAATDTMTQTEGSWHAGDCDSWRTGDRSIEPSSAAKAEEASD
ncbi:hypothetical protein GUJ93_ZPchr0013g36031 [Zizania palustris]|uniref:Uncharacterized protein n=1 Tax=Zizania palustris TaxID=103762 RepID=A0A8J6C292_ZIZPA|nr:hypothetical protein GUJ93_ZPchr0013g36031 [Zizania palustris]